MWRCAAVVALVGLLAGACGGNGNSSAKDPIAACGQFRDAMCAKQARCGSTLNAAECAADLLAQGLDCRGAIAVRASFDQCLADLEVVMCTAASDLTTCDKVITIGDVPPPTGALGPCFTPTPALNTCNAYCASVGKACASVCAIFQGIPADFAGITWSDAGVCPNADKGIASPSCTNSVDLYPQARCCCTQ